MKVTRAKGSDRPVLSAAIRPRAWYMWHLSWNGCWSGDTKRRFFHIDVLSILRIYKCTRTVYLTVKLYWKSNNKMWISPKQNDRNWMFFSPVLCRYLGGFWGSTSPVSGKNPAGSSSSMWLESEHFPYHKYISTFACTDRQATRFPGGCICTLIVLFFCLPSYTENVRTFVYLQKQCYYLATVDSSGLLGAGEQQVSGTDTSVCDTLVVTKQPHKDVWYRVLGLQCVKTRYSM